MQNQVGTIEPSDKCFPQQLSQRATVGWMLERRSLGAEGLRTDDGGDGRASAADNLSREDPNLVGLEWPRWSTDRLVNVSRQ